MTSSPHLDPASTTALSQDDLRQIASRIIDRGIQLAGPLAATLITGGRSNLTFQLTDGIQRWVLRMPPRVGRTPSAHDIAREFRVTEALASTDVPVAHAVLLEEDESLIGGPFAVSEFVAGRTIQTQEDLDSLTDVAVSHLVEDLVATLARLHRVDHTSIGLGGFGRPDSYAARQLRRWSGQWGAVGPPELRARGEALANALSSRIPIQRATSVVHGDFRLDNTILNTETDAVAAVVDWELSTIGDPVADVAMMCAYRHQVFDRIVGAPSAWTSHRLPDPSELATAYEAAGGLPLADWESHLALAYFKIAVIAAGIEHRRGAGAASGPGHDTAADSIEAYLHLAEATLI